MTFTAELYLLTLTALATALMWIPYTIAGISRLGLAPALANPLPRPVESLDWAQRAKRAHANAVENLVVFAPLVLVAALIGASSPATVLASKIYLAARLVHYGVYVAGIPVVRTLAFVAGAGATLVFAASILAHAG